MSAADVAPAVASPAHSATAAGQARPQRGWACGSWARSCGSSSGAAATWPAWASSPSSRSSWPSRSSCPSPEPGGGPDFLSSITDNGLFVALAALTVELRPVPAAGGRRPSPATPSPARPTSARCATCSPSRSTAPGCWRSSTPRSCIFSVAATLLVAVVGVGRRAGPLRRRRPDPALRHPGRLRRRGCCGCCSSTLYLALCFAALGAIGLFVSTLTEQPIGATIAVVIINVLSFILDAIPQLAWLHPWLLDALVAVVR